MGLIAEQDRTYLQDEFDRMEHPVRLVLFTRESDCQFCRETRQIVEELTSLSDNVQTEIFDLQADAEHAQALGVDKAPAIVLLRADNEPSDYGIRYYGIPSGYEFSSLVEDILMIGRGDSGLQAATREALADLKVPVHIQVFVTPTCPYCPRAVHMAHQMAFESPLVHADMVEAMEFPDLAVKYDVMGVPRIVINEETHVEGAVPEPVMLQAVLEAVEQKA
ncbi:MAG: thioredoxin family protein [Ardenticatenia bacterium]|nr:thioredoxin family protein [Ardenticatenia bacterium]